MEPRDINRAAKAMKLKMACHFRPAAPPATRWEAEIAHRSFVFIGAGARPEAALKQAFKQLWDDLWDKLEDNYPPSVVDAVVRLKR